MFTARVLIAILIRPTLWPSAVGFVVEFAPRNWWQKFPFLPIPDRQILEWRVTTAYGRADMTLAPHDVVSYLRWRRIA